MVTNRLSDKDGASWPTVRRLFDIEQAADFARVPVQEIHYQIRTGKLQVYQLGGGRVRIDEADLLASIEPRELEW